MSTNITSEHRRDFQVLTRGEYANFELFSCFIDGCAGPAIVAVNQCPPEKEGGPSEYVIRPLFVSVPPTVTITDHDGTEA